MFYNYTPAQKETSGIDLFLSILDESGVSEIIGKHILPYTTGRLGFNTFNMFACIVYGYATGHTSLRELEELCRYDLRFIYIMEGAEPSYMTFCRYINEVIKPEQEMIFAHVTKAMLDHLGLDLSDCFIDGTKMEANANKYRFVWKPTRFHERLCDKARNLLSLMGLSNDIPDDGIFASSKIAEKISEAASMSGKEGIPEAWEDMIRNLAEYLLKATEYEEMERICGPDRNSYYKTDHDATAMCLKQDYYSGLGGNMHAAYQIQLVVSAGFNVSYYISHDRTDIYTFIPTMDKFHRMYGIYPKRICADSGYGCSTNYAYCKRHDIRAFVKYQQWEGESSGRNPALYELNDDGTITCLGNRIGHETRIENRHPRKANAVLYRIDNCIGCAFMPYCRRFMKDKQGDFKIFEVNKEFQKYKQEARDLLLTTEGIEMRVNRSCQMEGCFGILKQDREFDRFSRRGMEQVSVEFMLEALGHNTRKFLRYAEKGKVPKYWSAPIDIEPERFKKPSAKRLANRERRKAEKTVNEVARKYKYRKPNH